MSESASEEPVVSPSRGAKRGALYRAAVRARCVVASRRAVPVAPSLVDQDAHHVKDREDTSRWPNVLRRAHRARLGGLKLHHSAEISSATVLWNRFYRTN